MFPRGAIDLRQIRQGSNAFEEDFPPGKWAMPISFVTAPALDFSRLGAEWGYTLLQFHEESISARLLLTRCT